MIPGSHFVLCTNRRAQATTMMETTGIGRAGQWFNTMAALAAIAMNSNNHGQTNHKLRKVLNDEENSSSGFGDAFSRARIAGLKFDPAMEASHELSDEMAVPSIVNCIHSAGGPVGFSTVATIVFGPSCRSKATSITDSSRHRI